MKMIYIVSFSSTGWEYVEGEDGVYEYGNLACAGKPMLQVIKKKRRFLRKDPNKPCVTQGTYLFTKKIPFEVISKAASFFRGIWTKHKSEGIVFLYYSPFQEGEWNIVVPEQYVTRYQLLGNHPDEPTPNGWYKAGSIHSHGDDRAFHSKQDTQDEKFKSGIYITLGDIENPFFDCSVSVMIKDRRVIIPAQSIIETENLFPIEWMDLVHPLKQKGKL
jgi:hypothetical protein